MWAGRGPPLPSPPAVGPRRMKETERQREAVSAERIYLLLNQSQKRTESGSAQGEERRQAERRRCCSSRGLPGTKVGLSFLPCPQTSVGQEGGQNMSQPRGLTRAAPRGELSHALQASPALGRHFWHHGGGWGG